MKIIVHMGQGKTGTSSLQESLHAASDDLRTRGVLYPKFDRPHVAHQLLVALYGDPTRLPPWVLESRNGPEGTRAAARLAWAQMCEDIGRNRPELLVLSSEYLTQHLELDGKERLVAALRELSDDITPILYVRHPVDHYRSRMQQSLKHWDRPFPPNRGTLRERIVEIETAFGRGPELVTFDRKLLVGGDIVSDFATRFLSPWAEPKDLASVTTNVGLSAEALLLMVRLRAEAGGTYAAARRVAGLRPVLELLDQQDPPERSFTLLPEVAEAALRSAVGHRWLVESGRVQIPGLDIDRIDGAPVPDWMKKAPPEALFVHDPERLDRLRAALERHQDQAKAAETGKTEETRGRSINDFLLRFLHRKLGS